MQHARAIGAETEKGFAERVDELAADLDRRDQLTELLRESHPVYDQRSTSAIVRMRGWAMLALSRGGLTDDALLFVLEELDTGNNAYLVAAAAIALRSYPKPNAALAPFVMRAIQNIRYHDEPVSVDAYGEYADSSDDSSAVGELLATLAWLGPNARVVVNEVLALSGLPKRAQADLDRAVEAIRNTDAIDAQAASDCCTLPAGLGNMFSWVRGLGGGSGTIKRAKFEDQGGDSTTYQEFFRGHPSIVVFFYTRCDNPLKCSLTVTKLARIQKLLASRGVVDQIHTAAITYDPEFDHPERLRRYGKDRDVRMDARHRMLRTTAGFESLRRHFKLGVNFVESLVNRHRIEAYVLDAEGRIAISFQRLHWDETQVVNQAIDVLREERGETTSGPVADVAAVSLRSTTWTSILGTLAAVGVAFFPKCPVCWTAYMSVFGIASLEQVPYSPALYAVLALAMVTNLASVWWRSRATGFRYGLYLAVAGALAIIVSKVGFGGTNLAVLGVALTLAGSFLNAMNISRAER